MNSQVELSSLRIGAKIADGGQGSVYELLDQPRTVFKQYHDPESRDFRPSALRALVLEASSLSVAGKPVHTWAAWPTSLVLDDGAVVGFVMPRVPEEFTLAIGGTHRLADLSYLASEPRPLWGNVSLPDLAERLAIVRHLAMVMQALHQRRLILGDLSFTNVLWCRVPAPQVLLLDCDGIAPAGNLPVLPRAETIDWNDPEDPHAAGPALDRDRYKLACAIVRILTRSLDARPESSGLQVSTGDLSRDARLSRVVKEAAGPLDSRPAAAAWVAALSDRQEIEVQPPNGVRITSAPPPQPNLLTKEEPREFRPVSPPGRLPS